MEKLVGFYLNALKEQNPWVVISYVSRRKLTHHPDFKWVQKYFDNKNVVAFLSISRVLATKSHHGPRFKFGVQIPMNSSHALHLNKIHNNKLWQEAIKKELDSLHLFKTFRILVEGEELPPGYIKIPYHIVFDCKLMADGKQAL